MNKTIVIAIIGLLLLLNLVSAVDAANTMELRSPIVDLGTSIYTWTSLNFPGFYYEIDEDVGDEQLTFNLTNIDSQKSRATLSSKPNVNGKRGVVYTTKAKPKKFEFEPWDGYYVIGFLGEEYFAAYPNIQNINETETLSVLSTTSTNTNLLADEQLSKVLIDSDQEIEINRSAPLHLKEGYELAITDLNADGNKICFELKKNGQVVDTSIVNYGSNLDATYCYKKDIGDTEGIVTIGVHFDTFFLDVDVVYATVDGIFQISDQTTSIEVDKEFNKMSIRNIDPIEMRITMDNKDEGITLKKDEDILLMPNIRIKTADQDIIDSNHPLRYYIYKKIKV